MLQQAVRVLGDGRAQPGERSGCGGVGQGRDHPPILPVLTPADDRNTPSVSHPEAHVRLPGAVRLDGRGPLEAAELVALRGLGFDVDVDDLDVRVARHRHPLPHDDPHRRGTAVVHLDPPPLDGADLAAEQRAVRGALHQLALDRDPVVHTQVAAPARRRARSCRCGCCRRSPRRRTRRADRPAARARRCSRPWRAGARPGPQRVRPRGRGGRRGWRWRPWCGAACRRRARRWAAASRHATARAPSCSSATTSCATTAFPRRIMSNSRQPGPRRRAASAERAAARRPTTAPAPARRPRRRAAPWRG